MDVTNGHLDCWTIFWTIFWDQFKEGANDQFSLSAVEGSQGGNYNNILEESQERCFRGGWVEVGVGLIS